MWYFMVKTITLHRKFAKVPSVKPLFYHYPTLIPLFCTLPLESGPTSE